MYDNYMKYSLIEVWLFHNGMMFTGEANETLTYNITYIKTSITSPTTKKFN